MRRVSAQCSKPCPAPHDPCLPEHLKGKLEAYIAKIGDGKVRLHRTSDREGLIRARSIGAKEARSNPASH